MLFESIYLLIYLKIFEVNFLIRDRDRGINQNSSHLELKYKYFYAISNHKYVVIIFKLIKKVVV